MRTWKEMKARLAELEKQNAECRGLLSEFKTALQEAQALVHEKQERLVEKRLALAEARLAADSWKETTESFMEKETLLHKQMDQVVNLLSIMELPKNPLDCVRREYILDTLRGEKTDLYRLLTTDWTPVDCIPAVTPQPMGTVVPTPLYSVYMTKLGDKKINVIKTIREYTNLGLKEAKDLAESPTPVLIKERVFGDHARDIMDHLRMAGAEVEIREV